MTMRWRAIGWIGLCVLACAGCGGQDAPASAGSAEAEEIVEETEVMSLEALGDAEWWLVAFAEGEPAPEEPVITLAYVEGKFAGTSGCNRYFAAVTAGREDLAIEIGPAAGTMMMCPEAVMEAEQRYLGCLAGVTSYRLDGDSLYLAYAEGQAELRFVRAPAGTPE